jgi:hypothetical protein
MRPTWPRYCDRVFIQDDYCLHKKRQKLCREVIAERDIRRVLYPLNRVVARCREISVQAHRDLARAEQTLATLEQAALRAARWQATLQAIGA